MALLRSGSKTAEAARGSNSSSNNNNNNNKNGKSRPARMTTVIFVALLVDLLAFTLILPLLPALLDHYRRNDKGGLYPYLEGKVGFPQLT